MAEIAGSSLVGDSGERFDDMVEARVPEEDVEEVKQGVRRSVSESLEELDEGIEAIKDDITANAVACSGVLKMRASKAGVTYTVNVCTSSRAYGKDAPTSLPTHIQIRPQDTPG